MIPCKLIAVTPCEYPDKDLLFSILKLNTAYAVLHLGNDLKVANSAIETIYNKTKKTFGVCFGEEVMEGIKLTDQVDLVICSDPSKITLFKNKKVFLQIKKASDVIAAEKYGATGIIIKGNEGAGIVSKESSFVLFQKVKKQTNLPIWVQGGVGIHTAPALIMAGAEGVVLDSQLALFPESRLPQMTKEVLYKIDGTETQVIDGYRILRRPNSPEIPETAGFSDIKPLLGKLEIDKGLLPLGQDISISRDFVSKYKNLKKMFFALDEAIHGQIRQAKAVVPIRPNNAFAKEFNIKYPIAQGPMTRVSDVPEFANSVASSGGLPFIALSLVKGKKAIDMIEKTKALADGKTWGVGVLGFAPTELREEQMGYIKEAKPPVVLIAGGRPSQAKPLEEIGIKTFLHVPSTSLLDMFIKEGATGFVFEGRECGGHVGPLSSLVLWERQISRLLEEDDVDKFNILFAGGIHDDVSAAMISVMAAPLAVKGAKIGVLMGTSYLFTEEAVKTGAILEQFQKQAVKYSDTVLLETAPGHETRCLETPFADFFREEKEKYINEGLDKKEIWSKLEHLNVGRLRIASKGIERKGSALEKIDTAEQLSTGMYMIGEVASLRDQVITMEELHEQVAVGNNILLENAELPEYPKTNKKPLDIAIVGMSCIYPGAKNIDEYWKNILLGKDAVTEVPEERWNKELYYDPNATNGEKTPSKWGGFIPSIDFDPMEFGIPPQSLAAIEPTQLLSLLVAKRALEDAGYADPSDDNENVSVIFGAEGGNDLATSYGFRCLFPQLFGEIPKELDEVLPKMTEDSFPGVLANVISGRITNRLDLGGRNYTVDAACASSLAAVDLACQELILEKSDMVLAGGVDLHNGINDYLMFSSTHALSRKGRCKTFDKDADGIALGEGIAVVVLKRLEDAKNDGDKIYAVIKGVGGSSDGKSLGLTAPRRSGQLKALERAYEQAGISPADVGLVEAHGTGTVVGDKTEISALTDLMSQAGAIANQTHLGSVKTQIGHTKCAAGLAGLIKVALSLYHGVKPPTLQLENPNPFYKQNSSPFAFNTKAGLWNAEKRIAGVSAFGFGGTNFHTVIEANEGHTLKQTALKEWSSELFVFKGETYQEALSVLQKTQRLLQENCDLSLKNIAFSLVNINKKPVQLSIVTGDGKELLNTITEVLAGRIPENVYQTDYKTGKVAFMFPGQGSQRVNMARDLFVAFPAMREQLKKYSELEDILFPPEVFDQDSRKKQQEAIKDTTNAQPILGIVDLAIAKFMKSLGIVPDMIAGHSYGELPALCFSGVFTENDLVTLSRKRANAILDAVGNDAGTMLAVSAALEDLAPFLAIHKDIYTVNINSPKQIVLAGKMEAIITFESVLKAEKISSKIIPVACAFHSPLVAGAKENYQKILKDFTFEQTTVPVWSNTTASIYPNTPEEIKERLTEHLVMPVKFSEQITNMYANGARIFIEVGPGKTLSSLIRATIGKEEVLISTEDKTVQGIDYMLKAIAKYVATGRQVNIDQLFIDRDALTIDIQHPEKYAKSKTLWTVNGHCATPVYSKIPAHAGKPVITPLQLTGHSIAPLQPAMIAEEGSKQLVKEYLDNVKSMVNAQRDVVLGYLGQQINIPQTRLDDYPVINNIQKTVSKPSAEAILPVQQNGSIKLPTLHSREALQDILLDIVSDKTGYPVDMLGMDMDMEADLSIDSIKRMEITGALKEKLGTLQSQGKTEEQLIEQLASIKTLRGLIDWVQEHSKQPLPEVTTSNVSETSIKNVPVDIQKILIDIVSDKTGYPVDMLGVDMDMEADLSIDSIKRMEIIGALKIELGGFGETNKGEEELVEELTGLKTLKSLINWLEERIKVPENQEVSVPVTNGSRQEAEVSPTVWTQNSIQELLIKIISDKTGYPEEMLGLEMDLEADLSIDSIKRMEIIGEIRIQLGGFNTSSQNEEAIVEELAGIKTLQGLVSWITDVIDAGTKQEENILTSTRTIANGIPTKKDDKEKLMRWSFQLKTQKENGLHNNELNQKNFAITDDGGILARTIKATLEKSGANVTIIATNDQELDKYDGLILLDIFAAPVRPKITDFVSLVKKLDAKNVRWIYAISDLKSHLRVSKDVKILRNFQGYSGFLKSLNQEWSQANCRIINMENSLIPESTAAIVQEELLLNDNQIEVFYKEDERKIFELIPTALTNGTSPEIALDTNAVILVLGGAQGITAEMMIRFSNEYPCNFILIGRSSDPRKVPIDQFTNLKSKEEIKKELIALKVFKTPADIEKETNKIFKRNQVLNTIRSIEGNGARVDYHAMDLRDENNLGTLINDLYTSYNRIDGVIHGAGLLEDKLFQDKTEESFERVFSTKVTPVRILAEKLREDVQFVVLFSSVASVYGNKGQTDYAAANSVLDEYAWELKEKLKAKVISINWGPWKGAGMVSSTLEKEYERRGIALIPLKEGMETFINEIKYGRDSQVLIMAE